MPPAPRVLLLDDPGAPKRLDPLAREARARGAAVHHWRGPSGDAFEEAREAGSLEPVLEELDAELLGGFRPPWRLMGLGSGALLAQRVAVEAPAQVERFCLAGVPPTRSEVQRAHARTPWERLLADLPEWEWPEAGLHAVKAPALVLEGGGDAAYSPVGTMMWRAWLPESEVLRAEGTTTEALADPEVRARLLEFLLAP